MLRLLGRCNGTPREPTEWANSFGWLQVGSGWWGGWCVQKYEYNSAEAVTYRIFIYLQRKHQIFIYVHSGKEYM